jgi:hypothetical protein
MRFDKATGIYTVTITLPWHFRFRLWAGLKLCEIGIAIISGARL